MNVLIADDHDLVADALATLISKNAPDAIVSKADNLDNALELTHQLNPTIVVLDLNMPGMNGLQGIKDFKAQFKDIPVSLMSGNASKAAIKQAISLGASGFLPKTMSGIALVSALQLMIAGETYIPANLLDKDGAQKAALKADITAREHDVLQQLGLGQSNKEIARALSIEEPTVKLHIKNLCAKLDAKNRTMLIIHAMKLGYID